MMTFWLITALFIAVALAMVAVPLLRNRTVYDSDRNEQNVTIARERLAELRQELEQGLIAAEAFEQTKLELEKVLAGDLAQEEPLAMVNRGGKVMLGVLAVAVPVLTLTLYYNLGAPQYTSVSAGDGQEANAAAHTAGDSSEAPTMDELAVRLEQRQKDSPDNADGWFMLGRTYMALKEYEKSIAAFEQLQRLLGDDPQVLLSLADAVAMTQGGSMRGRPGELVDKALITDPNNATGLWMAGIASFEKEEFQQALDYFMRLKPQLADDPESMAELRPLIARTRQQLGLPLENANAPAQTTSVSVTAAAVQVQVTLDPKLATEVQPGDSVFIYAKAQNGPPMPLAAVRKRVADLPLDVILDDSMAMDPSLSLSSFGTIKIGARVSKSGNAIAQSGDLVGEMEGVTVSGSDKVVLTISRKIP
jgi:cytochrome c-type biogenesis protein CcmH